MAKAKRAAAARSCSAGAAGSSSKAKKSAEGAGPGRRNSSNEEEEEEERQRGGDHRRLVGPPPPPPPPRPEDRDEEEEKEENNKNDETGAGMWIKIPKRPNLFSTPETWWMVDLHADPVPKQGATPLVLRCMRELGWSEAAARANVRAYRQFLRIKVAAKDWNAQLLSPSFAVDQVWHRHVLDTANYAHDCRLLCDGHFVHHDPDGGLDARARKNRLEATRHALLDTYGDEEGEGGALDRSSTGPWKEVFVGGGANGEGPAAAAAAAAAPGGGGAAAEGGGRWGADHHRDGGADRETHPHLCAEPRRADGARLCRLREDGGGCCDDGASLHIRGAPDRGGRDPVVAGTPGRGSDSRHVAAARLLGTGAEAATQPAQSIPPQSLPAPEQ